MSTSRSLAKGFALAALALRPWTAASAGDGLTEPLYQGHRWFDLREAPAPTDRYASALIQGAVASAFNHPREAERYLRQAIRLAKGSKQVIAAREKLATTYLRHGRTREAVLQLRAILKADRAPRPDTQNVLDLFGSLSSSGDFVARVPRGGSAFTCEVKSDGVSIHLLINGKPATWLLDTGFNFSGTTESEARALGVTIHSQPASMSDDAGGQARIRLGVAAKLVIGNIEFRNIPLLIFPDNQDPFVEWPAGRRGAIGLPVAIAMQSISWKQDGTCRAGFPAKLNVPSNLAFDDLNPIVRGKLAGKPLDFLFDSGNQAVTQLWSRFADEFPAIVHSPGVTIGTEQVTQAGGSNTRPTTNIPELQFEVGGFSAQLKPAKLFVKPVGTDCQHGLLGMDVLSQANEVVIDFRSMTVALR